MEMTACLVTRGDVSIERWLASIPEDWRTVVYDNSMEEFDLKVRGRYAAIARAMTDVVFVQDDDCILPPESFEALAAAYTPGAIVTNMPERFRAHYSDSCLVGFGAIFDQDLPDLAFSKLPYVPPDFDRTCDVYFTALTENRVLLDLQYENLPWAEDATRMYRQADHVGIRANALERARRFRD